MGSPYHHYAYFQSHVRVKAVGKRLIGAVVGVLEPRPGSLATAGRERGLPVQLLTAPLVSAAQSQAPREQAGQSYASACGQLPSGNGPQSSPVWSQGASPSAPCWSVIGISNQCWRSWRMGTPGGKEGLGRTRAVSRMPSSLPTVCSRIPSRLTTTHYV